MSGIRSDRRKLKKLKVLELYDQGLSYRKIVSTVHMSLRDVAKYVQRVSNKTKSPSAVSVMDEVVLEYRMNLLRSEVKDLKIERDDLKNEVNDLRAQEYDLQIHARDKQN